MNFKKLTDGAYLVRTQAGLKQAMNDYGAVNANHCGKDKFKYPSLVFLSVVHRGVDDFYCDWVHVNAMKDFLKDQ